MFLVFNKDKAISYVVTVFTVVILFLAASFFKNTDKSSIPTSVNETKINLINNTIIEQNEILNNY